jgi:hypothetical protein
MWPFKRKDKIDSTSNPSLKFALDQYKKSETPENHLKLLAELNKARYLVPILNDEVKVQFDEKGKLLSIDPESKFKAVLTSNASGQPILPVFTDREEMKAWTELPVSSFTMSAQELWSFSEVGGYISEVVLNPAGICWVMGREHIDWLIEHPLKST